jgi:hypothetical protein
MKKEIFDENLYGFRLIYVFRGKRACGCLGSKAPLQSASSFKAPHFITNITTIRTSQPGQQCPSFIGARR